MADDPDAAAGSRQGQGDRVAVLAGEGAQFPDHVIDHARRSERGRRFARGAGAGELQHVVDLRQRALAAVARGVEQGKIVGPHPVAFDQVEGRDQTVKRRAHLVAHGGKEHAFGRGCPARLVDSAAQIVLGLHLGRDVADKGNGDGHALAVGVGGKGQFNRKHIAVRANGQRAARHPAGSISRRATAHLVIGRIQRALKACGRKAENVDPNDLGHGQAEHGFRRVVA